MAYINNYYVFVETEEVSRGVEVSSHPVEKGLDVTDNVKRSPVTISIDGEIVGPNATSTLSSLIALHQSGQYVKYSGRNILKNAIIESFDTGHPNTITGGCSFSMTIQEIRVAKSAYVPQPTSSRAPAVTKKPTQNGTQQVQSNTAKKYHTVKKGDTLWAIAKAYYGDGSQFNKIYEANKSTMSNPNVLRVGQSLLIP